MIVSVLRTIMSSGFLLFKVAAGRWCLLVFVCRLFASSNKLLNITFCSSLVAINTCALVAARILQLISSEYLLEVITQVRHLSQTLPGMFAFSLISIRFLTSFDFDLEMDARR